MRYIIRIVAVLLITLMALPAAAQDACTVSTPKNNTVRLRATPDRNGVVAGIMPANTPFNVTGKFLGTRNSVWFKLVKEEVAPTSTAAEVWVGAVAVTAAGNCDAVAVLNPAPAAPAAPAGDPNANTGGQNPAPAPAAALPRNGRWQITAQPLMTFSCNDGFTFTVDMTPQEVADASGIVRVRTSGNVFTVDGYQMDPTPDGKFAGAIFSFTQDLNGNFALALTVESDVRMSGMYVISVTEQGLTCAVSVPMVMDRVGR